jgi:hypothetical protein
MIHIKYLFYLDIEAYKFMRYTNLHSLLLSTFNKYSIPSKGIWNSMIEHCWKKCIDRLKENNQLPKEYQPGSTLYNIYTTNKYIYGFSDGHVWKLKLDFSDFSFEHSSSDDDDNDKINVKSFDYLNINIHLFNKYMNNIYAVFREEKSPTFNERIKWELDIFPDGMTLDVFKKVKVNNELEWNFICTRTDKHNYFTIFLQRIISTSLLSNDDIIILTSMGLFIYHFNEYNKSITLNYFYRMQLNGGEGERIFPYYRDELFSKSILPTPSYESFKLNNEWISDLINDRLNLLKYGTELLSIAIKEHKTELIDNIYKNCITFFHQDLSETRSYVNLLSIIITSMPLLNKYYPDYISRFSLDTVMITDAPAYHIRYRRASLHHHAFFRHSHSYNYTKMILWLKYVEFLKKLRKSSRFWYYILKLVKYLVMILILPISPIYYLLINILYDCNCIRISRSEDIFIHAYIRIQRIVRMITNFFSVRDDPKIPQITFIIPYVKFVCYPLDYDWLRELIKPQTSPFVEVKNRDIYKTWNGELLINFKWNKYGKYYYAGIWSMYMILFICFSAAASISLPENIRNQLLIASIMVGFIHLSFEVRQLIFNPSRWIRDFWNVFGMYRFISKIYLIILI